MNFKKIFVFIALSMVIGFLGCAKEKEEAPKQERITKNLVPPKAEVKGTNFSIELSDLQVTTTEDTTSKEIVETPSLMGRIKITNKSKDIWISKRSRLNTSTKLGSQSILNLERK